MTIPNESAKNAMKPSGSVLFFRTFFPYQLYRFVRINLRMLGMILKGHQ